MLYVGDNMYIDGKYIDEQDIVAHENNFLKKHNNIFITQNQIDILRNYDINIENYNNINELIYDIEECINNSYCEIEDLEWVSERLSEYNYYNNTNK